LSVGVSPGVFAESLSQFARSKSLGEAHATAYLAEIDAGLGRKEQAIRDGEQAAKVWSMERDARIAPDVEIVQAIVYLWSGEQEAAIKEFFEVAGRPVRPSTYSICPGLSAGELSSTQCGRILLVSQPEIIHKNSLVSQPT